MRRSELFDPPIIHIYNRADPNVAFFSKVDEMAAFETVLAETRHKFEISLYAYCLMPNHWHLVIQAANVPRLSMFIRALMSRHSLTYHSHRGSNYVPLYESACKTTWIRSTPSFFRACRYVERNPSEHGYAPNPSHWRYSSLWIRQFAPAWYRDKLLTPWPGGTPPDWPMQLDHQPRTGCHSSTMRSPSITWYAGNIAAVRHE